MAAVGVVVEVIGDVVCGNPSGSSSATDRNGGCTAAAAAVTARAEVETVSGGVVDSSSGGAPVAAGAAASARDAARSLRAGRDGDAGDGACAANKGSWSVFMLAFRVD